MIKTIIDFAQPLACLIFVIVGLLCLFIKDWRMAAVNLSIAQANFFILYGHMVFK
jgi:hypothetical protein